MNRNFGFPRSRVTVVMFAMFSVGCAEGTPAPTTDQATVSGSVKFDGKPITIDSTVFFTCQDVAANAAGTVDSLGNFTLRAADPKVGIPVGRYRVAIRPPDPISVSPSVNDPEYQKMMMQGGASVKPPAPTATDIPQKFMSADTSGIVLELKPGPNTFDFDLAKL